MNEARREEDGAPESAIAEARPWGERLEEPVPPRPACLNCGARLRGPFCHACGQEDRDPAPPLRDLFADLLAAAFNWDSRLLVSLRDLLRRPGRATVEYNAGRRVSRASPLRLYMAVSVLFIGAATIAGETAIGGTAATAVAGDDAQAREIWRWVARSAGWSMFLLVPAFAALLKLLYLQSGRPYVHHLIFAVHYHAFTFLVLTPLLLLVLVAPGTWLLYPTAAALTWIAVWAVLALRRVHGETWGKTILKSAVALWTYFSIVVPLGSIPVALLLGLLL